MRTVMLPDGARGYFHAITVKDGQPVLVVERMVIDRMYQDNEPTSVSQGRFVALSFDEVEFAYRQTEPLPGDKRPLDPLIIAAQTAAARAATPLGIRPGARRF